MIEILVVVAIIAILSVIAVTLYSNVQSDARDSKRKAELETISNVLEVNKTLPGYQPVTAAQFGGALFPGGGTTNALDPATYPYCLAQSSGTADATTANFTNAPSCSAGGTGGYSLINGTVPVANTASWKICTRLENRGTPGVFCRTNVQ